MSTRYGFWNRVIQPIPILSEVNRWPKYLEMIGCLPATSERKATINICVEKKRKPSPFTYFLNSALYSLLPIRVDLRDWFFFLFKNIVFIHYSSPTKFNPSDLGISEMAIGWLRIESLMTRRDAHVLPGLPPTLAWPHPISLPQISLNYVNCALISKV